MGLFLSWHRNNKTKLNNKCQIRIAGIFQLDASDENISGSVFNKPIYCELLPEMGRTAKIIP